MVRPQRFRYKETTTPLALFYKTMLMILIRGPICSGKSTLMEELRKQILNASIVPADRIKRAIDHTKATRWRDNIAFKTTFFLSELLIKRKRDLLVDVHSSKMNQYAAYKKLACKTNYKFYSFLLLPPLSVCLERNRNRPIKDVLYKISDAEVEKYWRKTKKISREKIYDTSSLPSKNISKDICKLIS